MENTFSPVRPIRISSVCGAEATCATASSTPSPASPFVAFGDSWIPAPTSRQHRRPLDQLNLEADLGKRNARAKPPDPATCDHHLHG